MRKLTQAQMKELQKVLASLDQQSLTLVYRYVYGLYQVANKSNTKSKKVKNE